MKTLHRLYLILAIIILGMAAKASAQTWQATPAYQPAAGDVAQMPFSVSFNWLAGAGWITVNGDTWDPVWPRNAPGAWYRPLTYTQPSIYKNPVFPYPYTCYLAGNQFRCHDTVRNIDRYLSCPASIAIGPLYKWRSLYNAAWPEQGLFWSNVGPFTCNTGRAVTLQSLSVTANGKRINCQYGPMTYQGAGLSLDVYCYRR